ncbi:unnamed protein product [Symbiodinium sp. CCMP2592]|nr:unnamed protein product [Symbiodinium sp. CCMP2592]
MRSREVMVTPMTFGRFSHSSRCPCTDLTTPARQGKRKASEKEQKEAQAKRFEQEARKGRPFFGQLLESLLPLAAGCREFPSAKSTRQFAPRDRLPGLCRPFEEI